MVIFKINRDPSLSASLTISPFYGIIVSPVARRQRSWGFDDDFFEKPRHQGFNLTANGKTIRQPEPNMDGFDTRRCPVLQARRAFSLSRWLYPQPGKPLSGDAVGYVVAVMLARIHRNALQRRSCRQASVALHRRCAVQSWWLSSGENL